MLKLLVNHFIKTISTNKGNIQKMFSVPKSKDPWTAMTKGSTGGWAKPFAKPATLLPTAAALAAIPFSGGVSAGFLPAVLGAAGGGIGAIQGATTGLWGDKGQPSSVLKGAGYGAAQGGITGGIGQMFGAGGTATTPGISAAKGLSPMQSWDYASGGVTLPSSVTPTLPSATGASGGIGALFSGMNPYQVGAGLATSLLPSLFSEKTQIPQSSLYGDITSKLLGDKGLSAVGQQGREALSKNLSSEFSPVSDEYYSASTRRLDEAYDKAEKDFTTQFQGSRPGADVANDSAYREGINKLRQDRAREKAGLSAELDYRREADYMDRQFQNVQTALGVDQQTMQDYMALAQMDANQLALNTGITLGEANQFKEIFGQLGGYLMQRGVGLDDPTKALQRIMQMMKG